MAWASTGVEGMEGRRRKEESKHNKWRDSLDIGPNGMGGRRRVNPTVPVSLSLPPSLPSRHLSPTSPSPFEKRTLVWGGNYCLVSLTRCVSQISVTDSIVSSPPPTPPHTTSFTFSSPTFSLAQSTSSLLHSSSHLLPHLPTAIY